VRKALDITVIWGGTTQIGTGFVQIRTVVLLVGVPTIQIGTGCVQIRTTVLLVGVPTMQIKSENLQIKSREKWI
jgi:hypothetical protein